MRSDLTTRISFFTHCHSTESPAHSFKATEQHNDAVHVSAYVFVCEYECVCVKCRAVGSKSRARRIYFHGPYGNSVVCVCKSTDNGRPQRSCVCTLNGVCVCIGRDGTLTPGIWRAIKEEVSLKHTHTPLGTLIC